MPSGLVAESDLRVDSKLSTMSVENAHSPGTVGCDWERWVQKPFGLGQDLEANTEFRHAAFSHTASAVWPFEVREGMEGEHNPETDLTRCHQHLEEAGLRFQT